MVKHEKKVNPLTKRIRSIKAQLAFEHAKQPADVKRMRTNIIVRTIIFNFLHKLLYKMTCISSALSFWHCTFLSELSKVRTARTQTCKKTTSGKCTLAL